MNKKLITVFTPTYNREHLLPRLFESLCNQTLYNFKWLIVDDGSTDNTKSLVTQWQKETTFFQINYIYKNNGGLHTGYNTAIENIDTELCMCIDSDDWCPNNAIEKITDIWNKIDNENYIGFIGLDAYENGKIVGDMFPDDLKEMYRYEQNLKYKISGDKQEIYKTEILKKVFPQKTYKGEKNFNPSYSFIKADKFGKLYVTNDIFRIVEYQETGMSDSMIWQYFNSPNSFAEIRKQQMVLPYATFSYIFKTNIHYISSCFLAHKISKSIKESPKKVYSILAFPLGILLGLYIKQKNERKKN